MNKPKESLIETEHTIGSDPWSWWR